MYRVYTSNPHIALTATKNPETCDTIRNPYPGTWETCRAPAQLQFCPGIETWSKGLGFRGLGFRALGVLGLGI